MSKCSWSLTVGFYSCYSALQTSREFAITALETQIRFLLCTIQRNSQMPMSGNSDLREKLERLQEQVATCKDCGQKSRRDNPGCPRMCSATP
jgi:hypothetical protein